MNQSKQRLLRRLKIIEGQIRGLQDMVTKNTYCIDIITQTSAVKRALSGVEDILMENHLNTCAQDQLQKGKTRVMTEEILKVYRFKNK